MNLLETSFLQQEPAEGAQVIENPAAGSHMSFQLVHIKNNELKGFLAAIGVVHACQRKVSLSFSQSHIDRFREQRDVVVGALDIVERSLGAVAHLRTSVKSYILSRWIM
jgi:hypothetical protein